MATATQSPVLFTGYLASKPSGSDLLKSSSNNFVSGIPLKALGRAQLGAKQRHLTIYAKLKPRRKDLDEQDPNVKGGYLRKFSSFQPLKEKPKPVILDFEKPLGKLREEIEEAKKRAEDLEKRGQTVPKKAYELIEFLERKYQEDREHLYKNLEPIQRVQLARHPHRPTFLDHVFNITEKFLELHGDRAGYDDPAVVCGLGSINGKTYMFIGQQKGRNTKENIHRNFGMPTPHGYRKALRFMNYADRFGFPIITFIDTPGAFADLKSEHLGQGEAIAKNLKSMFGLRVPVISIVIGEGGSGGALAIGCGNVLLMLENAVFYVASPEACAAILYKSAKAAPKAAKKLRITAKELCELEVADGVIPEPIGGAHADPEWTSQQIKTYIVETMKFYNNLDEAEVMKIRATKFRNMGMVQEGFPIDPRYKKNMKEREVAVSQFKDVKIDSLGFLQVKNEDGSVSTVRDVIGGKDNKVGDGDSVVDKIQMLFNEIKEETYVDYRLSPPLKEKIEQLYDTSSKSFSKKSRNIAKLKAEISMRFKQVVDRPDLRQKIEKVKDEIAKSGGSKVDELNQELESEFRAILESMEVYSPSALVVKPQVADLNQDLVEKFVQLCTELESEFEAVLDSLGFQVFPLSLEVKAKLNALEKTEMLVKEVVDSQKLKDKFDVLKKELEKTLTAPFIQDYVKKVKQRVTESLTGRLKTEYETQQARLFEKDLPEDGGLPSEVISENNRILV